MKWEPWEQFRDDASILSVDVPAPPCPHCLFWNPQRRYQNLKGGYVYEGVELCHSGDMLPDFSCFKERPEAK